MIDNEKEVGPSKASAQTPCYVSVIINRLYYKYPYLTIWFPFSIAAIVVNIYIAMHGESIIGGVLILTQIPYLCDFFFKLIKEMDSTHT